ncbi:MBL fold metallo-hydrolase [Thorsellia anophelis]|uniref:MBL fold metallo-hydrolase n=1 Tax=Thorsellia anophelis TaxID=336804 RepID=UPI000B88F871|nr:MBL fold metallo-hydrolase [Thorsellia anophelis]
MQYLWFPVTPFEQNCSLIWCSVTNEAVIVDPGGSSPELEKKITELNLSIKAIWLTHGHWDHAGAGKYYADKYNIEILGPHIEDTFLFESLPEQAARFGLSSETEAYLPSKWLKEGDSVEIGKLKFDVLHCPGHTPGHIVFIEKTQGKAWVGDVLFNGSIGRTDFPRGNTADLLSSIKNKLLPLGDDIEFYPGHGSSSTFGREKRYNPFLK